MVILLLGFVAMELPVHRGRDHEAWSDNEIKGATSLLDGSPRRIFECHNYFRKKRITTFNKFGANIVLINFLGLNIPKIIS